MIREAFVLIAALFLMVFMIGGVSANGIFEYNFEISNINKTNSNCLHLDTKEDVNNPGTKIILPDVCFYLTDNNVWPKEPRIESFYAGQVIDFYINGHHYFNVRNPRISFTTYYGGGLDSILETSTTETMLDFWDTDSNFISSEIYIWISNNSISNVRVEGFLIQNPEKRLSTLESWQQTINNTLTTIQNSIISTLNTLTGHNTRISKLENSTSNGTTIINNTTIIMSNLTNPYLKYLSSSDRKNMVCGYAEDNHLTTINDLGWNCTITYKTNRGRTTSSCKCKQ